MDVIILGRRNSPLALARLPTMAVSDFPDLLEGAQRLNPATTPQAVVMVIWRLGSRRLWANLRHRIPVTQRDLPGPRP